MQIVTKSLASDFSGNLKVAQFHTEVLANVITGNVVGANFRHINTAEDIVEIVFGNSLTGTETTALNELISTHTPDNSKPRENWFSLFPETRKINSESYVSICTFEYLGSKNVGTIDYIDVISRKHENIDSYDLQVRDVSHDGALIGSLTSTNDEYSISTIDNFGAIPEESSIFNVSVRKNGGKKSEKIYVEQIIVYHGN